MQKSAVSTLSAEQKNSLLDQFKAIVDAGELTMRSDGDDSQWTRWDSAIDRISIKHGIRLDSWKRIGPNKIGKPCGRGWVGMRGACKRGKKRLSTSRSRNGSASKKTPDIVPAKKKPERPPLESIPVFKGEYYELARGETIKVRSGDVINTAFFQKEGSSPPYDQLETLETSFSVNHDFNVGTARNAVQAMYAIKSDFKSAVAKLPDGVLLYNKPHTEDGKGGDRARVYQKIGFGEQSKDGGMYGVVVKGKLWPLTQAEYKALNAKRESTLGI